MPYARIETSGLALREGKIQIRLAFYLNEGDAGYARCHIRTHDFSGAVYAGEIDEASGAASDLESYGEWEASLPEIWRDNPFHNHFIYTEAALSDTELGEMTADYMGQFYGIWAEGGDILAEYREKVGFTAGSLSEANLTACAARIEALKACATEG